MHYHLEIIMPTTSDIEKAAKDIMARFSENYAEEDGPTGHEFWDFFVIGGRWAGTKEKCRYDATAMEKFYKEMSEQKITVSGLQCGKQTLKPASQIPTVDAMWNKYFPTENGEITPCPLFSHSSNQYDSNDLLACDICKVDEIPEELTAGRVIIAGPHWEDKDNIEAKHMICDSIWNGLNYMDTNWDGKVSTALAGYIKQLETYKEDYKNKQTPKPDWICVTVDYHS